MSKQEIYDTGYDDAERKYIKEILEVQTKLGAVESRLSQMAKALEPFARFAEFVGEDEPNDRLLASSMVDGVGRVAITLGDCRKALTAQEKM